MKRAIRTLAWRYERTLRLYPRAYRQEYDREMRSVFELTADEADRRGLFSLLKLCLRELCSLPGAIVHEHWRDARRNTLAGLIPFLFIGLWSIVLALLTFPPPLWQLIAYVGPLVAGYVVLLTGLGVGWARGFPRWSYAYVLCVPLFGALIPLAMMSIVVLVVTRSRQPLAGLVTNVWRDWTRLSFGCMAWCRYWCGLPLTRWRIAT